MSKLDVVVRLLANNKNFKAGLKDSTRAADSFAGRAGGAIQGMAKPAAIAGAAVAGMGALSVRAFVGFDDAMNQSISIMGDVSQTMRDDMAQAARDMAKQTRFSADQAAESYFFLASAGLDAKQSMAALPQVAAFAQAGMFDMATATDLLTDAQSALGLASKDTEENMRGMKRVSDVVVKANTLANASVQQFGESLQVAAPSAKQLGIDVEELTALLAVMADRGIKGSEAGTALAFTLPQLTDRARKNSTAWEAMGLTLFDASGEMRSMADIIQDLGAATAGMTTEQKDAAIAALGLDGRMGRTIKTFLGAEDQIRSYESSLRGAGGTTQEIAEKQLASPAAQFDLMKSRIMDVALSMGQAFLPAVLTITAALEPLLGFLVEHSEVAVGLVAVIGVLAGTILLANVAMKAWSAGIVIVKGATLVWTAAQWLLNVALTANPIGIVIMAIAALIAIIALIIHKTIGFKEAWARTAAFFSMLGGLFQAAWRKIKEMFFKGVDFIADLPKKIIGFFLGLPEELKQIGKDMMEGLTDGVKSLAKKPVKGVKKAGKATVKGAKKLFGIKSPSTVFEDMGLDVTAGFQKGLGGFGDTLKDPMADVAMPRPQARMTRGDDRDRRIVSLLQQILARLGEAGDGRVLLDGREVGRVLDDVRGRSMGRWEVSD